MAGARLPVSLVWLLACSGCQVLERQLGDAILAETYELSFERTADLIPPDGLRVTSTDDREISMTWNPVLIGDVAGYAVTRADAPEAPFRLIGQTLSRFGTVFTDSGETVQRLGDGKTFHYRIHPYDRSGRISRSHAYVPATTEPRPDTPTGFQGYSNLPRKVVLVWDPAERRSTTGYVIERSPTASGPFERIGNAEGRLTTVYEDPVPGDLRVLYYRIAARNRFGGESDVSDPLRAVTKAEPLPPIGLHVVASLPGRIDLGWDPNVEPDLAQYEIWRAEHGDEAWGTSRPIGRVDAVDTEFSDPSVACDQRVRYRVRASDADGLISAFSEPHEARGAGIALRLMPPATLRWDPAKTRDWGAVQVVRVRGFMPDTELAIVRDAASVHLGSLGPGRHRLRLTPQDPDPTRARVCEIVVDTRLSAPGAGGTPRGDRPGSPG